MPIKTKSGKWKWGNIERDSKKELVQTVYGIWKKNGSKGKFSDFWHGKHKVNEDKYEPPWTLDQIKQNLSKKYDELSKDPVHRWRAETGIELIHREPSREELDRIWKNWQLMDAEMKVKSEQKSQELFGMTNKQHYIKLTKESLNESSKDNFDLLLENPVKYDGTKDSDTFINVFYYSKEYKFAWKILWDRARHRSTIHVFKPDLIKILGKIRYGWREYLVSQDHKTLKELNFVDFETKDEAFRKFVEMIN